MLIVIGLLGLVLGALSYRRPWIGVAGIAAFGVVGAIVAVQRPTGRALDALPPVVGAHRRHRWRCSRCSSPLRSASGPLPTASRHHAASWIDRLRQHARYDRTQGRHGPARVLHREQHCRVGRGGCRRRRQLVEEPLQRVREPSERRAAPRRRRGAAPVATGVEVGVEGVANVHHAERRLLSHRHRARGAAGRGRDVDACACTAWSDASSRSRSTSC